MAEVGDPLDFWSPVFRHLAATLDIKNMDVYVQMNLLWSMARYIHGLDGDTKEKLIGMIGEQLKLNAGVLSKTKNQRHIFHFLPNLVWSLDTLGVDDPLLWSALIKDIDTFS